MPDLSKPCGRAIIETTMRGVTRPQGGWFAAVFYPLDTPRRSGLRPPDFFRLFTEELQLGLEIGGEMRGPGMYNGWDVWWHGPGMYSGPYLDISRRQAP
jgi:hypothetical protein